MKITAEIDGVPFYSLDDARQIGYIRLTKWLPVQAEEADYLVKEKARIDRDPARRTLLVHHEWRIALFVNPVAEDWEDDLEY